MLRIFNYVEMFLVISTKPTEPSPLSLQDQSHFILQFPGTSPAPGVEATLHQVHKITSLDLKLRLRHEKLDSIAYTQWETSKSTSVNRNHSLQLSQSQAPSTNQHYQFCFGAADRQRRRPAINRQLEPGLRRSSKEWVKTSTGRCVKRYKANLQLLMPRLLPLHKGLSHCANPKPLANDMWFWHYSW